MAPPDMTALLSDLHRLPDVAILALIVVTLGGLAMAAPHVGRRVMRLRPDEVRHGVAVDSYKAVLGMTGGVLAFALVQANANLHAIEALVAREGAALSATDRALLRSGDPRLVALRPALADYGRSIVDDEWPSLAGEDRSDVTDDAFARLAREARAASPAAARQQAWTGALFRTLADLAALRAPRIAASDEDLPSFFWITSGGLLVVALGLGTMASDSLASSVTLGAAAVAVALVLSFVVIVDQPFEGETSVSPKEIVKALLLNENRS